jgi:hypothetical protein
VGVVERQQAAPRARPSRRLLRAASFGVLPAALVVTGLLVSTSSYAVFNARTSDTANGWTGGTVVLQHDAPSGTGTYSASSTAALFPSGTTSGANGLQPGGSFTRCIDVKSTGSLPSGEVRLYGSVPAGAVASRITLTVVEGSPTSTCSGFTAGSTLYAGALSGFATSTVGKDYATGYGTGWTPSVGGNEVRAFRFTAVLDSGVISSMQGTSATTNLSWETQGT